MKKTRVYQSLFASMLLLGTSAVAQAVDYEVTITNLTRSQVFSPLLVVSHSNDVRLFHVGDEASDELVAIAEGGDVGPMEALLPDIAGVSDFANSGGPLPPGMSVSVVVEGRPITNISVLSMLVNTNDAFLALNGASATIWQTVSARVPAYDAGSEENDELCANIPGPACPGSPNGRVEEAGLIHIHNGIHGIGNLDMTAYDWRNPVADITIKRMR